MRFFGKVILVKAGLLIVAFLVNWWGWNVYAHLELGGKDLEFGLASGWVHCASRPHIEEVKDMTDLEKSMMESLGLKKVVFLDAGPFGCFAEGRLDAMSFAGLRRVSSGGASGLEITQPVAALVMFGIGAMLLRKRAMK